MQETLAKIPSRTYRAEEKLDDGSRLKLKVEIKSRACTIDFTGSGDVHPGNMNATPAIVNGVVIYVMRLLVDENIPLNEGLLEPVRLILPKGMLNPDFPDDPKKCPAIVGGNVEVSQRLTDTLLKPFRILACSQGTMNNILFGNQNFSYYETICGGCGAGDGFDGTSAVHHHMTNTRITDPEIMEFRYPVRLESFRIRKNSGGKGKYTGGNGVIREIRFLETANLSVLTQHRTTSPYGIKNGLPGKPGKQYVLRKDGTKEKLKSVDGCMVNPGDKLVIFTPGGGGFGEK
jgi:5-oxoprolinase (ATP-hydrolysing)